MGSSRPGKLSIFEWRPGRLARHSGALLAWMLLRAGAQAATVLLLARALGATDYGQFVSIIAVASFISPFVGLGLSNIVLRNGAKEPTHLSFYLSRAVKWWSLTLFPGIALACAFAMLLLPPGLPYIATFAAIGGELAASSLTELRARHYQAEHRINAFGAINAGLPLARLAALLLLLAFDSNRQTQPVLWAYAASSVIYTLSLWLPIRTLHVKSEGVESIPALSGMSFSLANFAMRLQAEFNKPVLAHLGFNLTGAYNVAQRANDLASLPLSALQESMWPRLYAHQNPIQEFRRTGLLLLLLSLACSCGIWLVAPLLPYLLGSDFAHIVTIMRGLALLPLLQSLRALLNFQAIHHNRMKIIGLTYAIGAVVSVASVAVLIPTFGVNGAVAASYASELAMIVFMTAGMMYQKR